MRFVLMLGSPIRTAPLVRLLDAGLAPCAVLTPAGAKHEPLLLAVRSQVEGLGIEAGPVRKADVGERLRALAADLVLCIGWPFLFAPAVVDGPWVLINSHPALLPQYRGPNPWAVILERGEAEAGVTIHKIDRGMDSGPILLRRAVALDAFDTYRSLRNKMVALEPAVVVEAIHSVMSNTARFTPQNEALAQEHPLRTAADCALDASRPLGDLVDRIRAADHERFPAYFVHKGEKVCVRLWRGDKPPDADADSL